MLCYRVHRYHKGSRSLRRGLRALRHTPYRRHAITLPCLGMPSCRPQCNARCLHVATVCASVCVCVRGKSEIWCANIAASSGRCQQCNLSGKRHNYLPLMAIKKRPNRTKPKAGNTATATSTAAGGAHSNAMHTSRGLRLRLLWLNSWRIYVLTPKRFEAPSKWAPRRRRHQSRLGFPGCCCSTALDWSSVGPCPGVVVVVVALWRAMGRMCYENSRRFACHRLAPVTAAATVATATVSHTTESCARRGSSALMC